MNNAMPNGSLRRQTIGEFDAWLAARGITLTRPQRYVAETLLEHEHGAMLLAGRGAGKTFLFENLERFVNEKHAGPDAHG